MTLPKKSRPKLKSSDGQILILFLLILVVGLAVVLSVASRTVTDIRITTTSDESSRAYFAAEAAIEEALKKASSSSVGDIFSLDFSSNKSKATVEIKAGDSNDLFVYPTELDQDGIAQIALMTPFSPPTQTTLNNATGWSGTSLTFFWGDSSGTPPAIEISIVYATQSGANWNINPGNIRKVIFKPLSGPCFTKVNSVSNNFTTPGFNFSTAYQAELTINSVAGCNNVDIGGTFKLVMVRVRTLYNGSPLAVRGVGADLPPQGLAIDSSGKTPSGVTRRIKVTRLYSSVPSLFDYVLLNGSTINPLQK